MIGNVKRKNQYYSIEISWTPLVNPATKLVIPAAAERRAGIQKRPCNYWIPAFAGMTGWWKSDGLFNCQANNYGIEGLI